MKYKLLCLDMDGTVLSDEKKVSEENLKAIKAAHKLGTKIAICTGRLFANARVYADIFGIKAPIIASNGAYIRDKDSNDVIYKCVLGKEKARKLYSIVEKYGFLIFFNECNCVISGKKFDNDKNIYVKMNKELPEDRRVRLLYAENMLEVIDKEGDEILKCICIDKESLKNNNYEKLNAARKEIERLGGFEIASSFRDNFEVMKSGVSKGNAVKVLADFYGIKQEEVMCIGDNENDLSMIEYAGMGVAMGNAEEIVKKSANYITDTNNNSGVAKAINEFIINA
ncbi:MULTISPECIES: Cof-type HAD-IIB family hydrolase [Clostridium]|uniref:Cof-type HAD-IIB family hydrolase n=1 Tax=Clostridium TaxID=1485 RepID=UPI00069F256C|nr:MULTISPECIES: Cof-type HAD-IIB family hydrolase [Clostridium]KOF57341.1 HAD family hydrolase [Clostridium sp. DMHC 10]MCD2346545.1 Cof-type HAD-IIB family hydrolase [Clostridium guangxiense]